MSRHDTFGLSKNVLLAIPSPYRTHLFLSCIDSQGLRFITTVLEVGVGGLYTTLPLAWLLIALLSKAF